jgi:hypothetical protein
LSVIGARGVLSMTSVLPVVVVLFLLGLEEEEPPQAATPRARTLNAATLFKTVRIIA